MATDKEEEALALGRYKLSKGKPLGTGGWCVVRRAEDVKTGKSVAVKTFGNQAVKDLGEDALAARFAREVGTFEGLGIGPDGTSPSGSRFGARRLLVNLLDYSKAETGEPGKAIDGQYYTVLELADEALDTWMRASEGHEIGELWNVVKAIAEGLACLHAKGQCHMDVKPDNVMRFGDRWKLIDFDSCLAIKEGSRVKSVNFTPLYASPELARFALGEIEAPEVSGAMDIWALGVVLLDIIGRDVVFESTKSGCDASELFSFEEPSVQGEEWYRWLSSSEPIDVNAFVADTPGAELLKNNEEVTKIIQQLLDKDPAKRLSAQALLELPVFVTTPTEAAEAPTAIEHTATASTAAPSTTKESLSGRKDVEDAFRRWDEHSSSKGMVSEEFLLALLCKLGLKKAQSLALIAASGSTRKGGAIPWHEFLDFIFGSTMPV